MRFRLFLEGPIPHPMVLTSGKNSNQISRESHRKRGYGKMKNKNIVYVFEDACLGGAKNKNVQQMIKPELNMADENQSVSGKEIITQVG